VSGISGIDKVYRIAAKLPPTLDYELHKEMRQAITEPVADMRREARTNIAAFMPSGYAPVFGGAFRILSNVGGGGLGGLASVRLRGTAKGRARIRDSAALNRGILRHKTYGRAVTKKGKSLWFDQGITPGFWDRAAEKYIDKLREKVREALERAAKKTEASL
jgi:hypothetical protein